MRFDRKDRTTKPCNSWVAWTRGRILLLLVLLSAVMIYHTIAFVTMNDIGDNLRLRWHNREYQPGSAEHYIVSNLDRLGFNKPENTDTWHIWSDPNATTLEVFNSLVVYKNDIDKYNEIVMNFKPVPSIIDKIRQEGCGVKEKTRICDSLRLHRNGMQGIFPSKQLSFTSSGYVEPLLPPMRPMRSHKIWDDYYPHLLSRKLKPTSRLVLLDMGAALDFHCTTQPIVTLLRQYEKFGFMIDHICSFQVILSLKRKKSRDIRQTIQRHTGTIFGSNCTC